MRAKKTSASKRSKDVFSSADDGKPRPYREVDKRAMVVGREILSQAPQALPVQLQRAFYTSLSGILKNPSLAKRSDAAMQRQMRNDPDIEAPLNQLKTGIASLDYQVTLPRSLDGGERGREICDATMGMLSEIPQFGELQEHLLEAVWYGPSAVNVLWDRNARGELSIGSWLPIHPDTLSSDETGTLGLRVGTKYLQDHRDRPPVVGLDGFVRKLDPVERAGIVLHTYHRRGPDYDVAQEAAYAFLGRGVRDVAWYYWMMKQTCLQQWMSYIERYAMGIRVGYYPSSQKGAKEQMEQVLRNLIGDVSALLPRSNPMTKDYEIEVKEPGAARAKVFLELASWLAGNIKELIVGQSATSESSGGWVGSGVAMAHERTFNRQMSSIAKSLAETITREIVRPLVRLNFGEQDVYPVFRYSVADPDAASLMEATKAFIDMGGEVEEDFIAGKLGFPTPREGKRRLSLKTVNAFFGPAGGGPMGGVHATAGRGRSNGHPVPAAGEEGGPRSVDEFMRSDVRWCFGEVEGGER